MDTPDFYDSVGVLAIASRLRRLTDRISADDVKIYELFGISFKPKWIPIYAMLMDQQQHSIVEIANATCLSHSSVSVMAKEMQCQGIICMTQNSEDARRMDMMLSDTGKELIPVIRKMMLSRELSVNKIMSSCTQNLWIALAEWEKLLDEQSFYERVKESMHKLDSVLYDK